MITKLPQKCRFLSHNGNNVDYYFRIITCDVARHPSLRLLSWPLPLFSSHCNTFEGRVPVDFTWWRHQMETFSALQALCAGNSPVTSEFPAQRPVTRSFNVFFDLRLINGWVNNREAGDLRRHRGHYDVIVMNLTITDSNNGRCQAISWISAEILLIGTLGTN